MSDKRKWLHPCGCMNGSIIRCDIHNPKGGPAVVDPAPPAAEPDAAESPLGISADIERLKTVSRFGGDLPPQIVFSDGEEYHRTLERVASHLLAMLPAPADVKGGDS